MIQLALIIVGATSWMIAVTLIWYLEVRIHALIQSGDLPPSSPHLWIHSGFGRAFEDSVASILVLYSARYRTVDGHTRVLVPAIRVLAPMGLVFTAAAVMVEWSF